MKQLILFFALTAPAFGQYTIGQWTAATAGTGGGSYFFNHPIAEIALYNGSINTSTLATYSTCKYGL